MSVISRVLCRQVLSRSTDFRCSSLLPVAVSYEQNRNYSKRKTFPHRKFSPFLISCGIGTAIMGYNYFKDSLQPLFPEVAAATSVMTPRKQVSQTAADHATTEA
jgi:hypothetical protein